MRADEDEDDDADPLNSSLQCFETLSHLALLDNPVDTNGITYRDFSALAGSSQVRSFMRTDPVLRVMHLVS